MALHDSDYVKTLALTIMKGDIDINNTSHINDTFVNSIDFGNEAGNLMAKQQMPQIIGSSNLTSNNYWKNNDNFTISDIGNFTSETKLDVYYLSTLYLVIDGFASPILASIGIILNVLGVCVLSTRSRRRKMFNLLLSTLLIFDE